MSRKRTRPRPEPTPPIAPALARPADCCTPYPYAVFKNQKMTELYARHDGLWCNGTMEPLSVEAWYAEIDARAAARELAGKNDR